MHAGIYVDRLSRSGGPAGMTGGVVMPPGFWLGIRAALVAVPAIVLVIYLGLLELAGLFCDEGRRDYVTELSDQAMWAIVALFHGYGPLARPPKRKHVADSRRPAVHQRRRR